MLEQLIWDDLKCTMDKAVWEENGAEYEDLPVKLTFCDKEEDVSLMIQYFEELDADEVCEALKNFLANWSLLQKKVLEKIYEYFNEMQEELGEESELDISCPDDMKEYVTLATLIINEHPTHGMCVGLGFDTEWDVCVDDYGDVGVLTMNGEIVEVGTGEVIM